MVMYLIHWERDPDFPRKDLTTKQKEKSFFVVTCLCRHIHNAVRCAEWYFDKVMGLDGKLRFSDGQVKCTRCKIDSRHFDCTYLLLDGMKEPFDLIDPKSNFNQFRNIF